MCLHPCHLQSPDSAVLVCSLVVSRESSLSHGSSVSRAHPLDLPSVRHPEPEVFLKEMH